MAEVIALDRRSAPAPRGKKEATAECKILFFTGIRYERIIDEPAKAPISVAQN